jgi:hypothetical protein
MSNRSAEGNPQAAPLVARAVTQTLWALIPVLSLSFLSFVPAAQVYWRARTAGWLVTLVLLVVGSGAVLTALAMGADGPGLGGVIIGTAGGGVAAATAGRRIVFERPKEPVDPAIEEVLQARERRQQAREIAATDPAMALELGIGRPDVPGGYADGGLVDLNNASAEGVARVLACPLATAEAFVAGRDARHGYASLAEIGALSNLDPRLLETHAEFIVVLPYRGGSAVV